jgi:hypothetical protein
VFAKEGRGGCQASRFARNGETALPVKIYFSWGKGMILENSLKTTATPALLHF